MGQSLMGKIQAKLELFRLEQRYTRRRNRRSTFVSEAIYVDGEYIYQTPNSTGSSSSSADSAANRIDALHNAKPTLTATASPAASSTNASERERKRLNRFSSVPVFGRTFSEKQTPRVEERRMSFVR